MLVLTRSAGQTIIVYVDGKKLEVTLVSSRPQQARIGFNGGKEFRIVRKELEKQKEDI